MEALEPVLKQKFWILLGIGLLMTFFGWWSGTGKTAAAIAERTSKIEAANTSIPTADIPNEVWTKRLAEVNGKQESSIKSTQLGLWKRQQERMVLPAGLPHVEYDEKLKNEERELFRDAYVEEVTRVWKTLNPMDADGTGVVNFPIQSMFRLMNQKPWTKAPPKSEIIWEVMEDLWLLEGLFQSITEANGGPDAGRAEACVHQIDVLELRGGGEKPSLGGSGGGSDDGSMAGFGGAAGMGMMGGMGMRGGGGDMGATGGMAGMPGGGAAAVPSVSAEFDVREEFGDDGSGAGGGAGNRGGGGGGGAPMGMMSSMAMMGGAMGGMDDEGMGSSQSEKVIKRYVTQDESLPYKTRGFYMSVKMDHRKIPQFISELTANEKSVWPVEILRVQMSRLHEDDATYASGFSGGSAGMRMGAAGGMTGGPMGGGPMGAMSTLGGGGDDEYDAFINTRSFGNRNPATSMQLMQKVKESQESLDIALRDPYMAQVTLCGVFTMYKKVEETKVEADSESTSSPQEADSSEESEASEAADNSEAGGPEMSDAIPATEEVDATEPAAEAELTGDTPRETPVDAGGGTGDDPAPVTPGEDGEPETEEK
ncbi:hypothetical protein [Schlesneria sp. T3-172]|uniref:hypothetical protein n=1 Tax=Schlesneria sphaerica TaxID=3373610 RepID=UPI0037C73039